VQSSSAFQFAIHMRPAPVSNHDGEISVLGPSLNAEQSDQPATVSVNADPLVMNVSCSAARQRDETPVADGLAAHDTCWKLVPPARRQVPTLMDEAEYIHIHKVATERALSELQHQCVNLPNVVVATAAASSLFSGLETLRKHTSFQDISSQLNEEDTRQAVRTLVYADDWLHDTVKIVVDSCKEVAGDYEG